MFFIVVAHADRPLGDDQRGLILCARGETEPVLRGTYGLDSSRADLLLAIGRFVLCDEKLQHSSIVIRQRNIASLLPIEGMPGVLLRQSSVLGG